MATVFKNKKVDSMLQLVKKMHKKQYRNNGKVPYWFHCLSVAEIVLAGLEQSKEINDNATITNIMCAALGHDLLEDTKIDRLELEKNFGDTIVGYIDELTNDEGDAYHIAYMRKIKNGSEEAGLIKYGDLIDNTIGVAYGLHDVGVNWAKKFFKPIKDHTKKTLLSKQFNTYPKTAELLKQYFLFCEERFENNLQKY